MKTGDNEIALIGFRPHVEDAIAYFDVFGAMKKDNKGWIFVCTYTAPVDKKDSLDGNNSQIVKEYLEILNSVDVLEDVEALDFESLDQPVSELLLEENRRINSNYETTF